jgi:hypothetical protein
MAQQLATGVKAYFAKAGVTLSPGADGSSDSGLR